jgi:non-specific serine/threonine protein kinase
MHQADNGHDAPLVSVLTPRQREVAGLIAEGLKNAEIAERLVISPGTAANHVEYILRRLRLRSRSQVAVWAVKQGLRAGDAG